MEVLPIFEIYSRVLLTDLLRYLIPASIAYLLFWVILKDLLLHRFIQKRRPKSKQLRHEFFYSMSTVFIFSLNGLGIHLMHRWGHTNIYTGISEYGWYWLLGSIVVMMLIHDTYFYWAHRLMHHPRLYRHVHRVHHQSTSPSPWAAYSFHPYEAMIEALVFWIIVFVIPVHPLALFSFLVYMIVRNVWGHLGIELFPKWFLRSKWLSWHTTTTHHDLHHKNFHTNYGLYFSWWDKWMGTEDKNYRETFERVTDRKRIKTSPETAVSSTLSVILICLAMVRLSAQSPAGTWQTFEEATGYPLAQIQISETEQGLEGKVVKLEPLPWQGKHPVCALCDGRRKNNPIVGMNFLWGFNSDGRNGHILDPASGAIYDCKMWLTDNQTLKVRGYTGPFNLFFRTQTWEKESSAGDINPFTGIWITTDDYTGKPAARVEIKLEKGTLNGTILELYPQPNAGSEAVCMECPGKMKGQRIVGMTILRYLERDNNRWTGGQILDPGNGRTYTSTVWLEGPNTLKVRGYLGPFYRTQTWRRITGMSYNYKEKR